MNLRYEVLNPLHVENWDSFLSQHPDATFFHSQNWAKVLSETYGYEPKYLSIFTQNELIFLLPMMEVNSVFTGRRGVSLPFSDDVKPIVTQPEKLPEIWEELVGYAKKFHWQYIDLRGDLGFPATTGVYESFYEHDILLGADSSQMFSRLKSCHRKNIKSAIRSGIEIEFRHDMKAVDAFYHLNAITRKRHGVPSQPYKFFENLYKFIIDEGKGIVVLAKYQDEVVAASIFFLFEKTAIQKYGASKKIKCMRANNLLLWEALNWLSNRNYEILSMGRTEVDNEGLLRYKNGWAAEQKALNYYRYSVKDDLFVIKRKNLAPVSEKFFKAAPVRLSNFLGGVLYRHVG